MQFIAELCSNIFGEGAGNCLPRYEKMCTKAVQAGATDVKLQMFKADKLYRQESVPAGMQELELTRDIKQLRLLKTVAEDMGLAFLVSPFDIEAVDILEEIDVYAYKVASWELSDVNNTNPMLERIAQTNKKIIMSTAAASMDEIWHNANIVTGGDLSRLSLLHCTSGYPTPTNEVDLMRIIDIMADIVMQQYQNDVAPDDIVYPKMGYSCHTPVPEIAAASVFFQGEIIEAHFDLDDKKGPESTHSFTPSQFAKMVELAYQFKSSERCETCTNEPLSNAVARRQYRKNPEDWLRPLGR
jgi:N,N'-diacetyllegionaminate synthase